MHLAASLKAALNQLEHPAVSICIANYNGEQLLPECIQSLREQIGGVSHEIIIHDDASTDGSIAWLRQHHKNIRLITSAKNVGFCAANNRMAAQANGKYLLLLNNDAALFPDALKTLLHDARSRSQDSILSLPQYDWETGSLVDRGCLLDPFYSPVPNLDASRLDVAMTIGACLWIPRTLWNTLGGFPEWFESIGEDLHLCCIARLHGAAVRVSDRSGYRHRQGASFGGNRIDSGKLRTTFRRRRFSERNRIAASLISTPTFLAWPLLAVHIAATVAEGLALSAVQRDIRPWREIYGPALFENFRNRGTLLSIRRQVQLGRQIGLVEYLRGFVPYPQKIRMLLRHGMPSLK